MPETSPSLPALPPDLLERFRRGDRDAFAAVYRAHAGDVRGWAGRFFAGPFEREDAVQEVWLTAHRMGHRFDPSRGELRAWLRALAINRCREILRARGRRPQADTEFDEAAATDALPQGPNELGQTRAQGPEEAEQARRLREVVARFAATLSPDEARILEIGLVQERSHQEAAAALGVNVRRCKYLKKKVLARAAADPGLRELLDEIQRGSDP